MDSEEVIRIVQETYQVVIVNDETDPSVVNDVEQYLETKDTLDIYPSDPAEDFEEILDNELPNHNAIVVHDFGERHYPSEQQAVLKLFSDYVLGEPGTTWKIPVVVFAPNGEYRSYYGIEDGSTKARKL
jgi:hypothetical protein